ncbi:Mur ligase family protein [Patescibacteria group bacterium]
MKIISITGTKGKTTIIRLLDYILQGLEYDTLRVDTDGHFINGEQKSDFKLSREVWGMVPNNCPGRFLYETQSMPKENTVALFECAIGCSSLFGMGYAFHDIGVITNIYDDHITKTRIKNRDDIYDAKKFILKKTKKKDGFFIFNSSDEFLTGKLLSERIEPRKIAVGEEILSFNQEEFLSEGNIFLKIDGDDLKFITKDKEIRLLSLKNTPITFEGKFKPGIYNLSFVVAMLISFLGEDAFFEKLDLIIEKIEEYTPDKEGGRLVFLDDENKKAKVVIDFAHEKESFKQIAKLAKEFSKNRVVGVLRFDPSRTNEDIEKTAEYIHEFYDFIYVYDKIDGVRLMQSTRKAEGKLRGIGETANVFTEKLKEIGYSNFEVVLEKKEAFKKAQNELQEGDVLIYIGGGDDHKAEYEFVKSVIEK